MLFSLPPLNPLPLIILLRRWIFLLYLLIFLITIAHTSTPSTAQQPHNQRRRLKQSNKLWKEQTPVAVLPPALLSSQQMEELEGREERETSNLNDGVDSNNDDQAIERIAKTLRIEKDQEDPSRLLNVFLPPTSQTNQRLPPNRFHQFIARVTDISIVDDPRSWDVNRTFLASVTDSSVINVHGLNAGHKYKVAILGRREAESLSIREEEILMDPVPLDFGIPGNSSSILATQHNITLRAHKPERALQDTFRIEYHQLDPLKRFPILDIHDLQEQREVELYIGNLSPGRDYEISVTSLREELPSLPWRGIVTTRPLRPENLNVVEINSTCVLLQWQLPTESGADRFKIAYGLLHGAQAMLKLEVLYPKQQIHLCQQIVPGRAFIFAVIAEKSRQISEPSTTSHTVKPLAPKDLVVEPDFESSRFRVRVNLASEEESHTEKCQISVQSEDQNGKSEQAIVPAKNGQICEVYFDLLPGRRYEFAATALSGSSAFSTRMLRNRAVEPGFDFGSFGLNLKETTNNTSGGFNSLVLEWPQSEVARLRIADLWARIVGRDSHLHFSIQPLDSPGPTIQRETGPTEPTPLIVDGLNEGECYKVLLYTVTSSGIVSERRFEQFLRKSAPQLDLAVGHLSSRAATIQTFYISGTNNDNQSNIKNVKNEKLQISPQCQLQIQVVDSLSSQLIDERTLTLSQNEQNLKVLSNSHLPSLSLDGLRPWRKYTVNGEVICGAQTRHSSPCTPKTHRITQVDFRTESAQPGPILNFTVRPLNSYSAQLRWHMPAEPNGLISHYIIQIEPQLEENNNNDLPNEFDNIRPWTEKVIIQEQNKNNKKYINEEFKQKEFIEKILDGLKGGHKYLLQVWAVNEAGQGKGSEQFNVHQPISAPPPPNRNVIQIVTDSVKSTELSARIDLSQISDRNGQIIKLAILVVEVDERGIIDKGDEENNEREENNTKNQQKRSDNRWLILDENNGTLPTWGMVQRHSTGIWPPFIALELLPDNKNRRFSSNISPIINSIFITSIGTDFECEEKLAEEICNGPLKPGSVYRIKLRLFTSQNLWTDSPFTDPIRLELSVSESFFGQPIFIILLFIILAGIGFVLFLLVTKQRNNKQKTKQQIKQLQRPESSNSSNQSPQKRQKKTNNNNNQNSLNNRQNGTTGRSEGQWHVLKMIMAERAADCLAKLGLEQPPPPPPSTIATTTQSLSSLGKDEQQTTICVNSPSNANFGKLSSNLSHCSSPASSSSSSPSSSSPSQQHLTNGGGYVLCGGAVNQNQLLFGAPHHRRSKSLRERTGVDQRLARLPSGPPPGQRHSTLLWTVLKNGNIPLERSRPVQISDFIEHVRLMSADSDFRFSEEYEQLRSVGLGQTCIAADLSPNRPKNRFTNILPYDHSRVKLKQTDDDDGSDYVNASYIPGFNSRREFIAAQGPLPSTRDHFWRLVWEQQVPAIIALTKCVEKGRDKCHQYWPDNRLRSVLYADIEVTLLTESIDYEEFTIRELRLTNLSEPGQQPRSVLHLHYQAWPDFGVPEHPVGIVHFARLFRNKLPPSPSNKPTIVHCSAGVGRSGTFIALDRLIQHIECGKPIDVFGSVYEMRLERCHMVQNEQQYIFIHQCLQYVLENFYPFLCTSTVTTTIIPPTPTTTTNSSLLNSQQFSPGKRSFPPTFSQQFGTNNGHLPFGCSYSSPITGSQFSLTNNRNNENNNLNNIWPQQTNNFQNFNNFQQQKSPRIDSQQQQNRQNFHNNEGFFKDEDIDEGIAESGL
ncbi:hypothetical protein ACQ4LE_008066 [Meloidogyne hapla]